MSTYEKINLRKKNRPIKFKRYEVERGFFLLRMPDTYSIKTGRGGWKESDEIVYFDYLTKNDSDFLNLEYCATKKKKSSQLELIALINKYKKTDLGINIGGIIVYIPSPKNLILEFSTPVLHIEHF